MRSSTEFAAEISAAGGECRLVSGGASYRAGGDIIVSSVGYWKVPVPVRVERTETRCFDGTGYDGRGRTWSVWRLVPDAGGMVPISDGVFSGLVPADRVTIGGPEQGSCRGPVLFGRPDRRDDSDITGIMSGLL